MLFWLVLWTIAQKTVNGYLGSNFYKILIYKILKIQYFVLQILYEKKRNRLSIPHLMSFNCVNSGKYYNAFAIFTKTLGIYIRTGKLQ